MDSPGFAGDRRPTELFEYDRVGREARKGIAPMILLRLVLCGKKHTEGGAPSITPLHMEGGGKGRFQP